MGNAAGGNIIIISDGLDGDSNKLQEAQAAVMSKGVIVDSILYTVNADEILRSMAKESSGNVYFEQGSTTTLVEALIETEVSRQPVGTASTPIQVKLYYSCQTRQTTTDNFDIGPHVTHQGPPDLLPPPHLHSPDPTNPPPPPSNKFTNTTKYNPLPTPTPRSIYIYIYIY